MSGDGPRWEHRRLIAALWTVAQRHGWAYWERADWLDDRFRFLGTPFTGGHERAFRSVLAGGHRGRHVGVFEYSQRSDEELLPRHHTVAVVTLPAGVPTLDVRPEGTGSKLAGLVGLGDLQLESDEFNQKFHIRCDIDRFAYDVLHPRMIEWLLAHARARTVPFRFVDGYLMAWDESTIDPWRVEWMVDYVCDIVERVPGFVWNY